MKALMIGAGLCATLLGGASSAWAEVPRSAAPADAAGYFIEPADGATVDQTFTVKFGLKGMGVAPAGVDVPHTGHHHLLINVEGPAKGETIPADAQHLHFGKGQTETELKLAPGSYKLTMQFADGHHASYGKDMSATITVTVK